MYAVVATGGKQVKVALGDVIRVERLDGEVGGSITFEDIKLVVKDDGIILEPSKLSGVMVSATILGQERAKKVRVYKKKKRKNYRRERGHRQYYTELKIDTIDA